jgi:hypothetical protein
MGEDQSTPLVADGTSQFGFSEAVHNALEEHYRNARPGTQFEITKSWVETLEHHSPWHITFNVKVEQVGSP